MTVAPAETVGTVADELSPILRRTSVPLTAAYCAERAATAIARAETAAEMAHRRLLACADQWRQLGTAMAGNLSMTRPRDDRDDRPRR